MQNPYEQSTDLVLRTIVPASSLSAPRADQQPDLNLSSTTTTAAASSSTSHAAPSAAVLEHLVKSGKLTATHVLSKLFPPVPVSDEEALSSASGAALSSQPGPYVSIAAENNIDPMTVIHLQESIENLVLSKEARTVGVCDLRECTYANALDELIRQVTVGCPERGLLLSELRDEMIETNKTFDSLFGNSCEYSVRKSIERDQKKYMHSKVQAMTSEVRGLENRVHELRAKYDGIDKRFNEQRAAEEKIHVEEVAFLKKGNLQLTNEIKRLSL